MRASSSRASLVHRLEHDCNEGDEIFVLKNRGGIQRRWSFCTARGESVPDAL
jgi:hypothetical protein